MSETDAVRPLGTPLSELEYYKALASYATGSLRAELKTATVKAIGDMIENKIRCLRLQGESVQWEDVVAVEIWPVFSSSGKDTCGVGTRIGMWENDKLQWYFAGELSPYWDWDIRFDLTSPAVSRMFRPRTFTDGDGI